MNSPAHPCLPVPRWCSLLALLSTLTSLLLLAGCASSGGNAPASRGFEAPNLPSTDFRKAPDAHVPTDGDWSKSPPQQRPGLATSFGENRTSKITKTRFKRAGSGPSFQTSLYYNDRPGLDVLMARQYWAPKATNSPLNAQRWSQLSYGLRGEDGQWLPTWVSGGRTFVEGKPGERYSIILINPSPLRREVVVSVDGLDVMDGQSASLRKRGYILDPGQEFAVEGFRTGTDTVATFRFGTVAESYSNQRHGTARNVGVIGLALFDEDNRDADRRADADAFPGTWATPPRR